MRRLPCLLVPILAGAVLASCVPMPPREGLQRREQDLLGTLRAAPAQLAVPIRPDGAPDVAELANCGGVELRQGRGELADHPALEWAWRRGQAPAHGVLGQLGGVWLRAVGVEARISGERLDAVLVARALHDRPFSLQLGALDASGALHELARAESAPWADGVHFALAEFPLPTERLTDIPGLAATVVEAESGWSARTSAWLRPTW